MANRNFANGGKTWKMHVYPVTLDCNFIVDSANGNGLGIRSLKGPCIANVFMHTSAPLSGSGNPNPAAGGIVVQLQDNYNRYYGGYAGFGSPVGTPSTATVANAPSFITSLGTATAAQWQAVGFPASITPAVGAAFIPNSTATIGGGATAAQVSATGAGIDHIEIVGDPNQTLAPSQTPNLGAQLIFNCFHGTTITQPADGTVISLTFDLSNSSVLIQGE